MLWCVDDVNDYFSSTAKRSCVMDAIMHDGWLGVEGSSAPANDELAIFKCKVGMSSLYFVQLQHILCRALAKLYLIRLLHMDFER
jgi:hypothetical protein